MGVAGDPFHDWWEPKTEEDERRLADNERRRRFLHPAWHRERDRKPQEATFSPAGKPNDNQGGNNAVREPEAPTGPTPPGAPED